VDEFRMEFTIKDAEKKEQAEGNRGINEGVSPV
jgi:hypothetical protein